MRNLLLPSAGLLLFLGITGTAADAPEAKLGTLVGTVRYTGKVPPPRKIPTTDGGTILHSDLVVDLKSRGLRFVVVVLEDVPAEAKVKKAPPVVVDQREMVFLPRIVAVQHGQAVRFENNDVCNHSVMASSTVKANQFNVFVTASQPHEAVFEPQKSPVQIGCSLHAWMRAWVYVVPHRYFAVSDEQGKFQIKGVAPGKHTLWLRHPDTGRQERRTVLVVAGQTAQLKIDWDKAGK